MQDLHSLALRRVRRRLEHESVYTHASLCEWVRVALGGATWSVHAPLTSQRSPSSWPTTARSRAAALAWLRANAPAGLDAEDLLDGHCEPMAILATHHAQQQLAAGTPPAAVADAAQAAASDQLRGIDGTAAPVVFASLVGRSLDDWSTPGPRLWAWLPLTAPEAPARSEADLLAGTERTSTLLAALGERAAATAASLVTPLYCVAYIFDADELDDSELRETAEETAQYSSHVLGLLLDGASRSAVLCDPNGALLPGGNMELLALPLRRRREEPSTAVSRFDLDQRVGRRRRKRTNAT
jgi:hypothetical protein